MRTFRIMWRGVVLAVAGLLLLTGAAVAQVGDVVPGFAVVPDFKAVARAAGNVYGTSSGYCSLADAIRVASDQCRGRLRSRGGGGTCEVVGLGDVDVSWLGRREMAQARARYTDAVESGWRARSRASAIAIEFLAYAGDAIDWDIFMAGLSRFDPGAPCLGNVKADGPSVDCEGFARFVGRLRAGARYPVFGQIVLDCSNGRALEGEFVTLEPGRGFTCLISRSGEQVMAIYGRGVHAQARTPAAFGSAYDALVRESGLDRKLCDWGLVS